jgi:hypothetical protein
MNRKALMISITFMFVYGFLVTVGSIFLVGWENTSVYQRVMTFALTFPVKWNELAVNKSLFFLLLNILFWSLIVYLLSLCVIKIGLLLGSKKATIKKPD